MSLFRTLGTSLAIPGNVIFTPSELRGFGFCWVSPKIQHGTQFEYTRIGPQGPAIPAGTNLPDVVARYHAAGLAVPGWGFLEGFDAAAEGRLAAQLVRDYNLDGYIANLETTAPGYSVDDSKNFVAAFVAAGTGRPLAVQVMGAAAINPQTGLPWAYAFDVKPWLDAGADFLPEAYWNPHGPVEGSSPGYEPIDSFLEWHVVEGVPVDRIHPTIGVWGAAGLATVGEYIADLQECQRRWPGFKGVNHYILEQTTREQLQAISAMVTLGLCDRSIGAPAPAPPPAPVPVPPPSPPPPTVAGTKAIMHAAAQAMLKEWRRQGREGVDETRIGLADVVLDCPEDERVAARNALLGR